MKRLIPLLLPLGLFLMTPNKANAQTKQDTINYAKIVLQNGGQSLAEDVFTSRMVEFQFSNETPNIETVGQAIDFAKIMTRPIEVSTEPSGNPNVDRVFEKYAAELETAFNKAVQAHPDSVSQKLLSVAQDTSLFRSTFEGFISGIYGFVDNKSSEKLAAKAFTDFGEAMAADEDLASFLWTIQFLEGERQRVVLKLTPPGRSWSY